MQNNFYVLKQLGHNTNLWLLLNQVEYVAREFFHTEGTMEILEEQNRSVKGERSMQNSFRCRSSAAQRETEEWIQIQKMKPFIKIMRRIQGSTEMREIVSNFLCQFGFLFISQKYYCLEV